MGISCSDAGQSSQNELRQMQPPEQHEVRGTQRGAARGGRRYPKQRVHSPRDSFLQMTEFQQKCWKYSSGLAASVERETELTFQVYDHSSELTGCIRKTEKADYIITNGGEKGGNELKEEIDALKLKSCQDDKKIKDLTTALKEKNAKPEQKIAQRHKHQADVTERKWLPEQLEELQMLGKQSQQLQHSDNQTQHPDKEWPYPQDQWANCQVTHPDPKCQSTPSQWLDHQACGDQQLQCPQVQHLEDPAYNANDDWPCQQAEWFRVQAHHPDQKLQCLQTQWLNHQPHCSQQNLQPHQGQWLDCQVHYTDQELQCQQGQWLHYQGDHLGQRWPYPQDQQPGFKSPHSDQELQVQQGQSTDCLQGSEQQDQPFDHADQQEGNQQSGHQNHYSDQQGQEPNNPLDLEEDHQASQQQQSQQADHQSHHFDQMCQGQKPDPQAAHLNQVQQDQCINHKKCNVEKSMQLSKLHSQNVDHQKDRPNSKTQQHTKLPSRTHMCRRSRHHQARGHCSQSKLPKEHLLRLSVKLGEHLPSTPQNNQKPACEKELPSPAQTRQHRKKRASHHAANERHPFSANTLANQDEVIWDKLKALSVEELRKMAEQCGITFRAKARKSELLRLLDNHFSLESEES
ncbi:protein lag-3-like [Heterodontus francisci]|uniref:protein lag-3-like n=1 Tax=Heterodontus francisci TaxID=7792 RepID=UPI00355B1DEE